MTIPGMIRKFEALDTDKIIVETLEESTEDFMDLNREQMYDGKTNTGADITPSYFNDPYFDTPEQAAAYSAWKDKITPNSRRTPGTPNLYINGFYYKSLYAEVNGDNLSVKSYWAEGDDIASKFKNIHGLGGPYKAIFLNDYVKGPLQMKITAATGLKFN